MVSSASIMGNVETGLFKEYESNTGTMLIRAIKSNSRIQVEKAIEFARKELATPNLKKTHDEDYELMREKMNLYLTRKYDIGDGMLWKKTPLELAAMVEAVEAMEAIKESLLKLSHTKEQKHINMDKAPAIQAAVGNIDQDRVALAKSRLQALRNKDKT